VVLTARAVYTVECAIVDDSTWVDLTNTAGLVVEEIEIKRGRTSDLGAFQMGTCQIVVHDPAGKLNPENPSSPYYGILDPLRPLRIKAVLGVTTYWLFYGWAKRFEHDPNLGARRSFISGVDAFEILGHEFPTIASTGQINVGPAIKQIVDGCGLTDVAFQNFATGDLIADLSADGTITGIDAVNSILEIDLGHFFIPGTGVITYRSRSQVYARQTAVATLGAGSLLQVRASVDADRIINRQETQRGALATLYTATNTASAARFRGRLGTRITNDKLLNDTRAESLGKFIVLDRGYPRPVPRGIQLQDVDDTYLTQILARDLGDFVAVTESLGGTTSQGTIVYVQHNITNQFDHKATWWIARQVIPFFTIGVSLIGGPDIIGY
jgi:hypothetical protein